MSFLWYSVWISVVPRPKCTQRLTIWHHVQRCVTVTYIWVWVRDYVVIVRLYYSSWLLGCWSLRMCYRILHLIASAAHGFLCSLSRIGDPPSPILRRIGRNWRSLTYHESHGLAVLLARVILHHSTRAHHTDNHLPAWWVATYNCVLVQQETTE